METIFKDWEQRQKEKEKAAIKTNINNLLDSLACQLDINRSPAAYASINKDNLPEDIQYILDYLFTDFQSDIEYLKEQTEKL